MADIIDKASRSAVMSKIRGKDTKIEIVIRQALHRAGYRFRLHDRRLPGCPDIVLKRFRAVIFVHGCFWHGHTCRLFRWPRTREHFWRQKIQGNRDRDKKTLGEYAHTDWRVATVWECAFRGANIRELERVTKRLDAWLGGTRRSLDIRGK